MKRKLSSIILLIVLFVSLAIPSGAQAASSMKLNKSRVVLEVDAKITLKLGDIASTDVKWKSSNKKVATVTSKGVVTAKGEGTAKITATYKKKDYTCKVTVVDSTPEFFLVQEFIDAKKSWVDNEIKEAEESGVSLEIFADDDALVYKCIFEEEVQVTEEDKENYEVMLPLVGIEFVYLVDEMETRVGVDNPKVKLIFENPDGTVVFEHTFE